MLIDITRYPLVLLPDECPSKIIVRTITAGGVSGILYQESIEETQRQTKTKHEVRPTETLSRGTASYLETSLPLLEAQQVTPIASVFEGASVLSHTVYKDPVSAWRVRIAILFKPESGLWHITAWDLTRNATPLLVISTKNLDPHSRFMFGESPPLTRAKRTLVTGEVPANMWTRLLEND
jgi:hypothetical protein